MPLQDPSWTCRPLVRVEPVQKLMKLPSSLYDQLEFTAARQKHLRLRRRLTLIRLCQTINLRGSLDVGWVQLDTAALSVVTTIIATIIAIVEVAVTKIAIAIGIIEVELARLQGLDLRDLGHGEGDIRDGAETQQGRDDNVGEHCDWCL